MQVISRAKFVLFLPVFVALGCQAPPKAAGVTQARVVISDYQSFVDQVARTLRLHDFELRRFDRARGRIVTEGETGQQFFEVWRADARGGYQLAESSLHTIRRVVRVELDPVLPAPLPSDDDAADNAADVATTEAELAAAVPASALPGYPPGAFDVRVEVQKARYNAPARQVTTASGALGVYSRRVPTEAGLRRSQDVAAVWTPLGRDVLLERFLLDKFLRAPVVTDVQD